MFCPHVLRLQGFFGGAQEGCDGSCNYHIHMRHIAQETTWLPLMRPAAPRLCVSKFNNKNSNGSAPTPITMVKNKNMSKKLKFIYLKEIFPRQ